VLGLLGVERAGGVAQQRLRQEDPARRDRLLSREPTLELLEQVAARTGSRPSDRRGRRQQVRVEAPQHAPDLAPESLALRPRRQLGRPPAHELRRIAARGRMDDQPVGGATHTGELATIVDRARSTGDGEQPARDDARRPGQPRCRVEREGGRAEEREQERRARRARQVERGVSRALRPD
jgi:hypothetical protein